MATNGRYVVKKNADIVADTGEVKKPIYKPKPAVKPTAKPKTTTKPKSTRRPVRPDLAFDKSTFDMSKIKKKEKVEEVVFVQEDIVGIDNNYVEKEEQAKPNTTDYVAMLGRSLVNTAAAIENISITMARGSWIDQQHLDQVEKTLAMCEKQLSMLDSVVNHNIV